MLCCHLSYERELFVVGELAYDDGTPDVRELCHRFLAVSHLPLVDRGVPLLCKRHQLLEPVVLLDIRRHPRRNQSSSVDPNCGLIGWTEARRRDTIRRRDKILQTLL